MAEAARIVAKHFGWGRWGLVDENGVRMNREWVFSREAAEAAAKEASVRKARMMEAAAQPGPDSVLVVKRRLTLGGMIYDVGSVVPPEALGRNAAALISAHAVEYVPRALAPTGAAPPRPVTPLPPAPPTVTLEQIDHIAKAHDRGSPVADWKRAIAEVSRTCATNENAARDKLLASPHGSALYLRAQRLACEAEARRLRLSGRRPLPQGVL